MLSGCATPAYIQKGYSPDQVGRIAVLPFIDGRQHPDPKTDFKYISSEATSILMPQIKYERNYLAFDTTDIGDVAEYSAQIIEPSKGQYAPPDYIKQLGPTQAKWVLVPVFDRLGRYNVVLYAGGSASLSFYLFNKDTGELWWKGSAATSQSMPGLIGGLAAAMDNYAMIIQATIVDEQSALKTWPKVKSTVAHKAGGRKWMARRYSIGSASDLQRIAVTSVVDGRRQESKNIAYEPTVIQDRVLRALHRKGYDAFPIQGFGQQETVSKVQVALADLAFGKSLAGVGSKYVLIPVADDVSNPPELVGNHYEFSFYLFNTDSGELIWEGDSFGKTLGGSMKALTEKGGLPRHRDLVK